MIRVSLPEAQERLSELLVAAKAGQLVQILDSVGEVFWLRPVLPPHELIKKERQPGSCKGLIEIHPDFKAPMEELREYME